MSKTRISTTGSSNERYIYAIFLNAPAQECIELLATAQKLMWPGISFQRRACASPKRKPMDSKHTPGPWKVAGPIGAAIWITDESSNNQIAAVYGKSQTAGADANARLIAAAPELLEALKEVVVISDREHTAWIKARAAIAKAEGRS